MLMALFIEMRIADTAAGQSYSSASSGFAERDVCATNADGSRHAAFAKVQANAGEDFDRAAKAKAHREIVRAYLRIFGSDCTERRRGAGFCKRIVRSVDCFQPIGRFVAIREIGPTSS